MKNKKIIFSLLMLVSWVFINSGWAADIKSYKNNYAVDENVFVELVDKSENQNGLDWIGIYQAGDSNNWGNVVSWVWANDPSVANDLPVGDWYQFKNTSLDNYAGGGYYSNYAVQLPVGEYEARFFLNNSFSVVAQDAFSVQAESAIQLTLDKKIYETKDVLTVNYTGMSGDQEDWLGIYKKGDTNDWGNQRGWTWSGGQINGSASINIENLPAGEYQLRAFFDNKFDLEEAVSFSIGDSVAPKLTLNKQSYAINDTLTVNYTGMAGGNEDWLGIYKKGDSNDWANQQGWTWSGGQVNGSASIDIDNLPAGEYELRAFSNNSFNDEAIESFVVREFWDKGENQVEVINLPNNKGTVYSPVGLAKDLPVVFFASGGNSNDHETHQTVLNFIASHGYHAVFIDNVSYTATTWTAEQFANAVNELKKIKGVNTQKIGVVGHSSGGGAAFGILRTLKETHHYGSDKSFLLAIDLWFAYEMRKQDLNELSRESNVVILQFGIGGNNMETHPERNYNYSTDALISLVLYKHLSTLYPENVDYKIFKGVDDGYDNFARGHFYLYDDITAENRANKGSNFKRMKGGLEPLGALMDFTLSGNVQAKNMALASKQHNDQEVENYGEYNFKCKHSVIRFGVLTDENGKLENSPIGAAEDVEYCQDVPRETVQ